MPTPVSIVDLEIFLKEHNRWTLEHNNLAGDFQFSDFPQAFSWMCEMALVAEKMNHHPQWSNLYNHVTVNLITHDQNSITELDLALAEAMDKAATRY